MSRGIRRHIVWLHFVLIATAIQGVTPDARNLASLNALRILCSNLSAADNLVGEDGLPDEACGLARFELELRLRVMKTELFAPDALASVSSQWCRLKIGSMAARHDLARRTMVVADDAIHSLCRLNC